MSGWVVLGIIVLVFVLIGCIPVGVDASYHENALALRLKIGFYRAGAATESQKEKGCVFKKEVRCKKAGRKASQAREAKEAVPDAEAHSAGYSGACRFGL